MSKARDLADSYDNTEIDNKLSLSKSASNVALEGSLSLANSTVTKSNANVTYTGNGTSQSITTGISSVDFTVASNGSGYYHDRAAGDCIVKNDAGTVIESGEAVVNVSKVHIKSRSTSYGNLVFDGIRGTGKHVYTDSTGTEGTSGITLTAFTALGFDVSTSIALNINLATYIAHQTLYTHIKWGLTSQGKRYLTAYNPVTREVMTMYQGSGIAGHQIPNPLGIKLDYRETKNLTDAQQWVVNSNGGTFWLDKIYSLVENTLNDTSSVWGYGNEHDYTTLSVGTAIREEDNTSNDSYISYGFANSETKIITQYQGTAASGNFVETLDVNGVGKKPRRVIIKRTDGSGGWFVWDSERGDTNYIILSAAVSEETGYQITFNPSGFTDATGSSTSINESGGQYIAIVEFDTNADGDDTYFDLPTDDTNLNVTSAKLPYTNGRDAVNGAYNVFTQNYTGTVDFSTCPDGIHYVALDSSNNPKFYEKVAIGSYKKESADDNRLVFDTESGKWFTTTGGELITNGTFDADSGWVKTGGASIVNGVVRCYNGASRGSIRQDLILEAGVEYTVTWDANTFNYTSFNFGGQEIGNYLIPGFFLDGRFTFIAANDGLQTLTFEQYVTDGTVDNISVFKTEPTLVAPLTNPISFIDDKPYQVASGTPMDRLVDYPSIPKNVMESSYVDGDLEVSGAVKGKNACTAWVYFDGTTTPPTIRDSYNVSDVVRTATGKYDIYFEEDMDNTNYSISGLVDSGGRFISVDGTASRTESKFSTEARRHDNDITNIQASLQIFGGK